MRLVPEPLVIKSLALCDIRVSRVSRCIGSPNSITVERIARQSAIRITGGIRAYLRDLHKVRAVVALTTLNLEDGFVARIVRPRQIDLAGGHAGRG